MEDFILTILSLLGWEPVVTCTKCDGRGERRTWYGRTAECPRCDRGWKTRPSWRAWQAIRHGGQS